MSSPPCPRRSTRPWSITTRSSASWSASSRYCVVSRTVVPVRRRARGSCPTARCGSAGRARSSARRGTAPAALHERRRRGPAAAASRPSRCAPAGRPRRSARSCSSSSSARGGMQARLDLREPADQPEVLAAGEVLVDGRVLAREADPHAHRVRIVDHVVARAPPRCRRRAVAPSRGSRTAVVLPAPLGPSNPKTVPSGISKSIPARACTSPNRFVRPVTRTAVVDMDRMFPPCCEDAQRVGPVLSL